MFAEVQAALNAAGRADVVAALKAASHRTGSDFDYLLSTAIRESGLNSTAKSATSSAAGLFQFVDQTWLGLVKRFGGQFGLAQYANAIEDKGNGRYAVASADAKSAILALRQNPELSALMAGVSANATKQSLECALGREVCGGELYAAHFLGEGGARQLIQLNASDPNGRADLAFPQAAKVNRSVFYRADGTPKTVGEVYAWAVKDAPGSIPAAMPAARPTQVASAASPVSAAENVTLTNDAAKPVHWRSGENANGANVSDHGVSRASLPIANADFGQTASLPLSPLLMTPGVMEILAAFSPAPALRRAS